MSQKTTFGDLMYSYKYNEKMLKDWITNHSEDFGRLCGEMFCMTPKLYLDFTKGFIEALNAREKDSKTD